MHCIVFSFFPDMPFSRTCTYQRRGQILLQKRAEEQCAGLFRRAGRGQGLPPLAATVTATIAPSSVQRVTTASVRATRAQCPLPKQQQEAAVATSMSSKSPRGHRLGLHRCKQLTIDRTSGFAAY